MMMLGIDDHYPGGPRPLLGIPMSLGRLSYMLHGTIYIMLLYTVEAVYYDV
jgi:hypothetical protein